MNIPFNKPCLTGKEIGYIREVLDGGTFQGDRKYSRMCAGRLEDITGCRKAIPVPSGTAALEMMMMLAGIAPGDEVIMPSFTFSSTANAVVLRGGIPVFVDIRRDTLNLDESKIEEAVTPRTKAIVPMHYAGVGCGMDELSAVARRHGLLVLEDAAQCIFSFFRGKHLGAIGNMGILSFHESKNVHCGEGGALLINDPRFIGRAEIVMEKGTDRSRFLRGEVDRYTWMDVGSSFLMNELTAAFLFAQLSEVEKITSERLKLWNAYFDAIEPLEQNGILRRPVIPEESTHNGHIFYVLMENEDERDGIMEKLKIRGVHAASHYIPLETSSAGKAYGNSVPESLPVSRELSGRLLRLPLYPGMESPLKIVSVLKILLNAQDDVARLSEALSAQELKV